MLLLFHSCADSQAFLQELHSLQIWYLLARDSFLKISMLDS